MKRQSHTVCLLTDDKKPMTEPDMRVLIQDCRSSQFYAGKGRWVESDKDA